MKKKHESVHQVTGPNTTCVCSPLSVDGADGHAPDVGTKARQLRDVRRHLVERTQTHSDAHVDADVHASVVADADPDVDVGAGFMSPRCALETGLSAVQQNSDIAADAVV